jgi:atlastin
MTFLVRDWQFPDEHAYGFEGGANLLSSRLDTCQSDFKSKRELNELLTDLKRYFKNRNCFLMPHPGPAVTKKDFNGNLNELNPEFLNCCQAFFKTTLENINLSESEIRSSIFRNGENLFQLFRVYIYVQIL